MDGLGGDNIDKVTCVDSAGGVVQWMMDKAGAATLALVVGARLISRMILPSLGGVIAACDTKE